VPLSSGIETLIVNELVRILPPSRSPGWGSFNPKIFRTLLAQLEITDREAINRIEGQLRRRIWNDFKTKRSYPARQRAFAEFA
jgi:hypothetical protein